MIVNLIESVDLDECCLFSLPKLACISFLVWPDILLSWTPFINLTRHGDSWLNHTFLSCAISRLWVQTAQLQLKWNVLVSSSAVCLLRLYEGSSLRLVLTPCLTTYHFEGSQSIDYIWILNLTLKDSNQRTKTSYFEGTIYHVRIGSHFFT